MTYRYNSLFIVFVLALSLCVPHVNGAAPQQPGGHPPGYQAVPPQQVAQFLGQQQPAIPGGLAQFLNVLQDAQNWQQQAQQLAQQLQVAQGETNAVRAELAAAQVEAGQLRGQMQAAIERGGQNVVAAIQAMEQRSNDATQRMEGLARRVTDAMIVERNYNQQLNQQLENMANQMRAVAQGLGARARMFDEHQLNALREAARLVVELPVEIRRQMEFGPRTTETWNRVAAQINAVSGGIEQIQGALNQIAEARKAQAMSGKFAAKEYTRFAREIVQTPSSWFKIGALGAVVYAMWRGAKMGMTFAEKFLMKPTLVKETDNLSWYDRLKGAKLPAARDISELVISPVLLRKLRKIAEQFKMTVQTGEKLKNLLFYGPPGTGKTMYATILARWAGLHYAIIPASSILKFAEETSVKNAILELEKLFDWAASSDKPVILFFDEIDLLFGKRKGSLLSYLRPLVTHILTLVPTPSNPDFAVVGTTNIPEELDKAILSRFADMFEFGLPELPERIKLLENYMKKEVVGAGIKVEKAIVTTHLKEYAKMLKDFSPRDIEELANEFRRETKFQKSKVLTDRIARPIVLDKVEQKRRQSQVIQHYDMGAAAPAA